MTNLSSRRYKLWKLTVFWFITRMQNDMKIPVEQRRKWVMNYIKIVRSLSYISSVTFSQFSFLNPSWTVLIPIPQFPPKWNENLGLSSEVAPALISLKTSLSAGSRTADFGFGIQGLKLAAATEPSDAIMLPPITAVPFWSPTLHQNNILLGRIAVAYWSSKNLTLKLSTLTVNVLNTLECDVLLGSLLQCEVPIVISVHTISCPLSFIFFTGARPSP